MIEAFAKALTINLAVTAIWYALEWMQFGELQFNRECDNVVSTIYLFVLWYLFWKKSDESDLS